MDSETLEEILELFSNYNQKAFILWVSGIDQERNISEISELWEVKSNIFSKKVDEDKYGEKKFREILEDLGLIEVTVGKANSQKINSKTEWLADLATFADNNFKERNDIKIGWSTWLNLDDTGELRSFFTSPLFRKKLMSLDLILEEVRWEIDSWNQEDNKEETDLWKKDISWQELLNQHIKAISFFKGIQEAGEKAEEMWESGDRENREFLGFRSVWVEGELDYDLLYERLKDENIPDVVEPDFKIEDKAEWYAVQLNYLKNNWNELYQEIEKRLE